MFFKDKVSDEILSLCYKVIIYIYIYICSLWNVKVLWLWKNIFIYIMFFLLESEMIIFSMKGYVILTWKGEQFFSLWELYKLIIIVV